MGHVELETTTIQDIQAIQAIQAIQGAVPLQRAPWRPLPRPRPVAAALSAAPATAHRRGRRHRKSGSRSGDAFVLGFDGNTMNGMNHINGTNYDKHIYGT